MTTNEDIENVYGRLHASAGKLEQDTHLDFLRRRRISAQLAELDRELDECLPLAMAAEEASAEMRSRVEREQSNLSAERERWQLVQRDLDRDTKERRQEIEFHQKRIGALVAQHKVELEQLTAVEEEKLHKLRVSNRNELIAEHQNPITTDRFALDECNLRHQRQLDELRLQHERNVLKLHEEFSQTAATTRQELVASFEARKSKLLLSYSGEVSRAAHAERVLHKHLSAQAAKASEQLHQFSQLQVHQTQITLDKMRADLSTARQQADIAEKAVRVEEAESRRLRMSLQKLQTVKDACLNALNGRQVDGKSVPERGVDEVDKENQNSNLPEWAHMFTRASQPISAVKLAEELRLAAAHHVVLEERNRIKQWECGVMLTQLLRAKQERTELHRMLASNVALVRQKRQRADRELAEHATAIAQQVLNNAKAQHEAAQQHSEGEEPLAPHVPKQPLSPVMDEYDEPFDITPRDTGHDEPDNNIYSQADANSYYRDSSAPNSARQPVQTSQTDALVQQLSHAENQLRVSQNGSLLHSADVSAIVASPRASIDMMTPLRSSGRLTPNAQLNHSLILPSMAAASMRSFASPSHVSPSPVSGLKFFWDMQSGAPSPMPGRSPLFAQHRE